MEISALGAVFGLIVAIVLVVLRIAPAYALIFGAFLGGLCGGADPSQAIAMMTSGAKDIIPATMRIITAGVLAGVLIESGAATRIAATIIRTVGQNHAPFALALATLFLTAVGVFIDVAVITVSPIAIALFQTTGLSRTVGLVAMIGGGKAGNVISPNPNTITAAEEFGVGLPNLMAANIVPALFGFVFTVFLARYLQSRSPIPEESRNDERENDLPVPKDEAELPPFGASVLGPMVTIALLALRPVSTLLGFGLYEIDPMIALPVGGLAGCLAMGRFHRFGRYMASGLQRMSGVAILLLGTGTIAGIIKHSTLKDVILTQLSDYGLPGFLLAPISGILMGAATASTTAGTAVASSTFSGALLAMGLAPLGAAAMIHTGATVLDHLPHGSFFHATGGAVGMNISERLRIIPYESAVGLVLVVVSTIIYGLILR